MLKKTPGPAPAAGPGLGKTPPSLGASTRVPPASGSGNADANITSNTLAVDFDPPLPPMAPMAPAPAAWAGPPAAPVAPRAGSVAGRVADGVRACGGQRRVRPARRGLMARRGRGVRAPAPRAGRGARGRGRAGFARARAGHLRSGAGGSPGFGASGGAPVCRPARLRPRPARRRRSRAASPPRRRASPGGGTRRLPRRRPPLPPMPHPARAQSAVRRRHLRRFLLGVVSRLSFGGRRRDPVRRVPAERVRALHHERFDSDEFRAEGRELEDELMALTGGLMHLDDDDDEISPSPKPEEEARVATTTTDRGSVFPPERAAIRERRQSENDDDRTRRQSRREREERTGGEGGVPGAARERDDDAFGFEDPRGGERGSRRADGVFLFHHARRDGGPRDRVGRVHVRARLRGAVAGEAQHLAHDRRAHARLHAPPNHSMRSQMMGFAERL